MSLVLFDREAAEAAPATMSALELTLTLTNKFNKKNLSARRYDKICVNLLMTMSLVLFDMEAAEAAPAAMSAFELTLKLLLTLTLTDTDIKQI